LRLRSGRGGNDCWIGEFEINANQSFKACEMATIMGDVPLSAVDLTFEMTAEKEWQAADGSKVS
jgi:hypothetical protein